MPKAPLEQRSDDLQPKHAKAASPLEARKKKRSIIILAVLLAFLLCGVAAGCGYLIWQRPPLCGGYGKSRSAGQYKTLL